MTQLSRPLFVQGAATLRGAAQTRDQVNQSGSKNTSGGGVSINGISLVCG